MSRHPCNRELHEPLCKQCGPIHGLLGAEDDSSDVGSAAEDDASLLEEVDTPGVVDERLGSGLRAVSPETLALCTADLSLGPAHHGLSEDENNSSEVESETEDGTSFQNIDDHQNLVDEQPHSGPQIARPVSSSGQELRFAGPSSAGTQSSAPSLNSAGPLSSAGPASSAGPKSSAPSLNSAGPASSAGPLMDRHLGDRPQLSQPPRRVSACPSTGEESSEQRGYSDRRRGSYGNSEGPPTDRASPVCDAGRPASAGLSSSTNRRHRIDSETGASCRPRDGCGVARRATVTWTRRVSEPAANRDGWRLQASQGESPQLHVTRHLERRPPPRQSVLRPPPWADRPASRRGEMSSSSAEDLPTGIADLMYTETTNC